MMKAEYLELVQSMIRCKAVSKDVEAVNRSHDLLKAFFDARNVYNVTEVIDGRKTLYASTEPGKVCDYLLNAHIDVVPAAYENQFEPYVEENRLYGRGAGDDLSNAMLMVQLICENMNSNISVGAIFTSDEEIGGHTTAAMVKLGYLPRKCAVVLDSWGRGGVNIAQKGILSLKLTARGQGGHSSTPWGKENSIDKLLQGYMKFAATWDNGNGENQWCNTMAATQLNAGFAHNQIPDTAEMVINFRCISNEMIDDLQKKVPEITGLETEVVEICYPMVSDPADPELNRLLKLLGEERQNDPQFQRMNGATDARHLGGLGVPVAIMGLKSNGVHAAVESLDLTTYQPTLNALQRFIAGEK